VSGVTPGSLIPGALGGVFEATPVSTTVGGTQLASLQPPPEPTFSTQPLTLVVGAAATLIVLGLVAAVWVGSDTGSEVDNLRAETFVPAIQPPSSLFDDLGDEPKPRATSVEAELDDDPHRAGASGSKDANKKPATGAAQPPSTDTRTPTEKSGKTNEADKPTWF
jgi:membrane peptidoglycan carboxypeptidase